VANADVTRVWSIDNTVNVKIDINNVRTKIFIPLQRFGDAYYTF
jgi:hypothetical protein